MPNPDDLTHQYQQTIAESNRKIFSIEPVQVGQQVYMGTVIGGEEAPGKGTVLKGQEPAQAAPPAEPGPHDELIDQAASRHGLDPALLKAVVQAESSGRADVTNQKGATGLMQLMPETAAEMGVQDATDPAQNLEGGAKYLSNLVKKYDGDTEKALAAYNFGPGNVDKGKPLPKETKSYIQKIMSMLPSDEAAEAAAPQGAVGVTPRREFTVDTPEGAAVRQQFKEKTKPYVFDLDTFDVPGDVLRAGLAKLSGVERGEKAGDLRMSSDEMVEKVFFKYGDKPQEVIKQAEALGMDEAQTLKVMAGLSAVVLGAVMDPLNVTPGGKAKDVAKLAKAIRPEDAQFLESVSTQAQAIAERYGLGNAIKDTHIVGSRAAGTTHQASDTDVLVQTLSFDEYAKRSGGDKEELRQRWNKMEAEIAALPQSMPELQGKLRNMYDVFVDSDISGPSQAKATILSEFQNVLPGGKAKGAAKVGEVLAAEAAVPLYKTAAGKKISEESYKAAVERIKKGEFHDGPTYEVQFPSGVRQAAGATREEAEVLASAFPGSTVHEVLNVNPSVKQIVYDEFKKAAAILKQERGSIRLGASGLQPEELTKLSQAFQETMAHTQAAQDPKILEHFAKAREGAKDLPWTTSVKGQTRSVLSDPEVLRLSKKSNLTMEAILGLPPGTSLPIEDMQKVYTVLEDAFAGMQRATIQVKERGLPEDYQVFFAAIGEVRTVTRILLGLHAETGRAQRGMRVREVIEEAMSAQQRLAAREAAERPQISDPWLEQLYEHFEEEDAILSQQGLPPGEAMRQLVEAVAELKSPEQLTQFIKSIEDPRFWDAWTEQWYNALLTGLAVVKNMVGSPVILFSEIGSRAFSAGINAIGTGMVRHVAQTDMPRNIYMGETGQMLYAVIEAFTTGLRGAWHGFTKMKPLIPGQTSMAGELIVPKVSSTSQYLHLTGIAGRAMDYFSSFGPRLLVAGDNFNSAIAYQAQLRALALRKGYQTVYAERLSGAEAAQRIQQIKTEVFANSEKYLELHAEAEVFAAYVTVQEKLGESGQAISTFASTLTIGDPARGGLNGFPIGRVLAPFTKITTNSTKMAGEWTGPLSLASQAVRDEIAAGGARRDAAMGKVAFSTLFVATMWELAANKLITGTGPKDPDARRQLEATGWKPNAWWDPISNEYRPMAGFEPFNTVAGGIADLYDVLSHAPTSQDWVQRTQLGIEAVVLSIANNIGVKPYLMGLIGLANGVFSGSMDDMDTYMRKQGPSLVTPWSGGLRQFKQGIDPTTRQAMDFKDAMMKDLPGLSATLPPERDGLGDPIRRTGGFWNPWAHGEKSANAPVWQALTDHSIVLGSVGDVIDGVKLTGRQKDKYVQLATEGLAEELDDALVGKEMTDQEAERIVRQAQTWRRKQAQQIMRDGDYFPELALKLEEQQERKKEGDPIKQSPFSAGKLRKSDFEAPTLR